MAYGILTATDVQILERSLDKAVQAFGEGPLRVLEVGVHDGNTARGISAYLHTLKVQHDYWAVDSGKECRTQPFDGCHMVWGDSAEVFMHVPGGLHWVFIDGCHCVNHAILDFCHYGSKVVPGGFVALHDVSPLIPGRPEYMGHGPPDRPEFHTSVRLALERLGLSPVIRSDWRLTEEGWCATTQWGGMAVYERIHA